MHQLFIISDGTGRTAEQAVNAMHTQFSGKKVQLNLMLHFWDEKEIITIVWVCHL